MKSFKELWGHHLADLERQFKWLLKSPGLGLLTADPGLGKTSALRQLSQQLNPHQYLVQYIAETDFGRIEFYRRLAEKFGLCVSHRRMDLWRDIKAHVTHLATQKNILPIIIIDEGQNLPSVFLKDFPSFLNFVFDSKDYMTVWLVGHNELARTIDRPHNTALATRIQARCQLQPISEREAFKEFLLHGLAQAGCTTTVLSDSGIEILRMASKGNPRLVHQLITMAMRIAADKRQNHLPDDVIKEAIEIMKQS